MLVGFLLLSAATMAGLVFFAILPATILVTAVSANLAHFGMQWIIRWVQQTGGVLRPLLWTAADTAAAIPFPAAGAAALVMLTRSCPMAVCSRLCPCSRARCRRNCPQAQPVGEQLLTMTPQQWQLAAKQWLLFLSIVELCMWPSLIGTVLALASKKAPLMAASLLLLGSYGLINMR